jgi:hypothetical protein
MEIHVAAGCSGQNRITTNLAIVVLDLQKHANVNAGHIKASWATL